MNKYLPFILTLLTFILVWGAMIHFPEIEKTSPNKAYAYSTMALFSAILVFVMLSCIYNFENDTMTTEERKNEFTYKYEGFW